MKVIAYDPYIEKFEDERIQIVDSIDKILKNSDFISLHLPYTPALHHFIDKSEFKKMKNNAYIINCARGGLINELELVNAINNNEIAGAGIDVFENEPINKDNILLKTKNIIATPHMGAATHEALTRMAVGAVENVVAVLNNEKPVNGVNEV